MTPSLYIDKRYAGVGRIHKPIGSTDPAFKAEVEAMLKTLSRRGGNVGLLRLVQDGTVHVQELYDAYVRQKLEVLPDPDELKDLKRAVDAWLGRSDFSAETLRSYRNALEYVTIGKKARLSDLPSLLARYRDRCKTQGKHRIFNLARAACQSLLRYSFNQYHRLYQDVCAIRRLPLETREKPDLTVEFCRGVAEKLGKNGPMWWAMCITGMIPSEYWGRWKVEADRIRIFGTKRPGRDRVIPLLWVPLRPWLSRAGLKSAMQDSHVGVTPKNARDAYAQWMEEAGIRDSHWKAYMGHGRRSMRDIYTRHDVTKQLEADAERMRAHIGEPIFEGLKVIK